MSIGYWLEEADITDLTNLRRHFFVDHPEDRFGKVTKFNISSHDIRCMVIVSPRREDTQGEKQWISTGDNAVGWFDSAELRGDFINRLTAKMTAEGLICEIERPPSETKQLFPSQA